MDNLLLALKHWANGLTPTAELCQVAKAEGYKLNREADVMHATNAKSPNKSFSINLNKLA